MNLHIAQGETIVLLGPNGSGKTSLLKTIIGIPEYKVESGRILFSGKDITRLNSHRGEKRSTYRCFRVLC